MQTGPFVGESSYKHLYNNWKGDVPPPERMKAPQYPVYSLPFRDRETDYQTPKDAFKLFDKPEKGKTLKSSLKPLWGNSPDTMKTSKQKDFIQPAQTERVSSPIIKHADAAVLRSDSSLPIGNKYVDDNTLHVSSHFKSFNSNEYQPKGGVGCKKALKKIALRKKLIGGPLMPAQKAT